MAEGIKQGHDATVQRPAGAANPNTAGGVGRGALRRVLRSFTYFRYWPDPDLMALAPVVRLHRCKSGDVLLQRGSTDAWDYFLVDGTVRLDAANERHGRELSARDIDAGYAVAHLQPRRYTVTALSDCHLVKIETSALKSAQVRRGTSRYLNVDRTVTGPWQNHPMWHRLQQALHDGNLPVPSLPAIAQRVQMQISRDDADIGKVAQLIQTEPSLSAKLIKVANSALMQRGVPCASVKDALLRLGLSASRQLVIAFASERLFTDVNAKLRPYATKRWQHCVEIAALSLVLARMTPFISPDRALLAGLLHEIGVISVLSLAGEYPDLAENELWLNDIVNTCAAKISADILQSWGFSDDIVQGAISSQDYFRDSGKQADYADLIIVAHLHAHLRQREFEQLPRIDETPAFGKLAFGELSPKLSLMVLDEARTQIQEMRSLLS